MGDKYGGAHGDSLSGQSLYLLVALGGYSDYEWCRYMFTAAVADGDGNHIARPK